jgi:spermidine synthase
MTTVTTNLFHPQDLEASASAGGLSAGDLDALRSVRDWIQDFIVVPNDHLGRPGPVCPYTPVSIERQVLWLAAEHLGDGGVARLVELLEGYKRKLLELAPTVGAAGDVGVIIVVLPDVSPDQAPALFGGALEQLAVPSLAEDGVLFGPFYDGHEGTAIYNKGFRPFQSPVPFVFVRHTVLEDWMFLIGSDDMLGHWASRFGESATRTLGAKLRQLPWDAPKQ